MLWQNYQNYWFWATLITVTVPLVYFGLQPVYLVEVLVQPNSEAQAQVLSKKILTKPDGNGVVFFDFQAHLKDSTMEKLFLEIRPEAEPKFYPQGEEGYRVDNGIVTGVAQLGSREWPLMHDENYTFRLMLTDRDLVLDGQILARVHPIAGRFRWVVLSIGVLASVLQILSAVFPISTKVAP